TPERRIAVAPVTGEVGSRVDALRRRWDPRMAARIESHVTVIYELADTSRLSDVVRSTPALRLRIARPALWQTELPGIYLTVEDPYADLARFRDAVLGVRSDPYAPHITVLHKDSVTSIDQVSEAWASLRDERFDADIDITELVVHEQTDDVW